MSFKDIKGQDKPIGIIRRQIEHSRLGSSFLFSGPEGIGKRLSAKTLAKALNCRAGSFGRGIDSCDECPSCLKIEQNQHPDVHFIADADSGSLKIDDIRILQKEINLRPYEAKYKVFIIDNAHNLTPEAANALLKILEEPPKDSLIILVSSKTALLFKTIISRCSLLKFYPLSRTALCAVLQEDYGLDNESAHFLSYFCEGRLGYALKLKESGIFNEKNRVIDALCVKGKSSSSGLSIEDRSQMRRMLNILAVWFRDAYLLKSGLAQAELVNFDRREDLVRLASAYSYAELDEVLNLISDSLLRVEQNINVKLLFSNLRLSLKN